MIHALAYTQPDCGNFCILPPYSSVINLWPFLSRNAVDILPPDYVAIVLSYFVAILPTDSVEILLFNFTQTITLAILPP